jgi:hypothetical protein
VSCHLVFYRSVFLRFFSMILVGHSAETCGDVIEIFTKVVLFVTCARFGVIIYIYIVTKMNF